MRNVPGLQKDGKTPSRVLWDWDCFFLFFFLRGPRCVCSLRVCTRPRADEIRTRSSLITPEGRKIFKAIEIWTWRLEEYGEGRKEGGCWFEPTTGGAKKGGRRGWLEGGTIFFLQDMRTRLDWTGQSLGALGKHPKPSPLEITPARGQWEF